jgi:hypothetical protein
MPDEQRIKALVEEIASIKTGDDWRDMLRAVDFEDYRLESGEPLGLYRPPQK